MRVDVPGGPPVIVPGPPATCRKCHATLPEVTIHWHRGDYRQRVNRDDGYTFRRSYCGDPRESPVQRPAEHLHYHCTRCQYDWAGPTMDADFSLPREK